MDRQIMEVNGRPYVIGRLLGRGKGGYSYLASGEDGADVVLKQIHHEPCSYYRFGDKLAAELHAYETLRAVGIRMPALLEVDSQSERLLKAYVPGPTVFELVEREALPDGCRVQLGEMCRAVYGAGLNIDYFPTNFVWNEGLLHYIDYECNPYAEQWDFEHWGCQFWERTPSFLEHAARLRQEAQELGIDAGS